MHPYLFEHHPERNIWSFWKTAIGGLRPQRFWTTLHPAQPSSLRRLLIYWCLAAFLMLGALGGQFLGAVAGLHLAMKEQRSQTLKSLRSDIQPTDPRVTAYLDQQWPLAPSAAFFRVLMEARDDLLALAIFSGVMLVWPWATYGTLCIFQRSMRHAKVRSVHVLRCALYACDLGLWIGVLAALPLGIAEGVATQLRLSYGVRYTVIAPSTQRAFIGWFHVIAGLALLIGVWRLTTAYAKYLRFHLPFATVAASQVILLMLMAVMVLNTRSPLYHIWFRTFMDAMSGWR